MNATPKRPRPKAYKTRLNGREALVTIPDGPEPKANPYLGQECRIVRAFRNLEGRQSYALKTATQTVAISADKALLIDIAEARYMKLTEILETAGWKRLQQ